MHTNNADSQEERARLEVVTARLQGAEERLARQEVLARDQVEWVERVWGGQTAH
jgi:transcription elongation GreA/GreB family factor